MFRTKKTWLSDNSPFIPGRRRLLFGLVSLFGLAACDQKETSKLHGVDLSTLPLAGTFQLRDFNGNLRSLNDFRGDVIVLLFGYTHCPDVCPTSLARAAQIKALLGDKGKKLQVLFVSVDPERDTPEILKAYTTAFDPTFIGLYGDAEQTANVAKAFGAFYRKAPSGDSYTMEHSSLDYVIDTTGHLRFALRYEESAQDCVDDLQQLL